MPKIISNLQSLSQMCEALQNLIDNKKHIIILLRGDIGAGKTTLIKEYARFCHIDECVNSPTFSLLHEYNGNGKSIFHYDLYNRSIEDLLHIGILDLFSKDGIHFVEWGDLELKNILDSAFDNVELINIDKHDDKRIYEF